MKNPEGVFRTLFSSKKIDDYLYPFGEELEIPKSLDPIYFFNYGESFFQEPVKRIYLFRHKRELSEGYIYSISELYNALKNSNQGLNLEPVISFKSRYYSWIGFVDILKYFIEYDKKEYVKIFKKSQFLCFLIDTQYSIGISEVNLFDLRLSEDKDLLAELMITKESPLEIGYKLTNFLESDIDKSKTVNLEIDYDLIPKIMEIVENDLWNPSYVIHENLNRVDKCKYFFHQMKSHPMIFRPEIFFKYTNPYFFRGNTKIRGLLENALFFSMVNTGFKSQISEHLTEKVKTFDNKVKFIEEVDKWPISYLESYCNVYNIDIKSPSTKGNLQRAIFESSDGKAPKSLKILNLLSCINIEKELPEIKGEINAFKDKKLDSAFLKIQKYIINNKLTDFLVFNKIVYFLRDNTLDLTRIGIKSILELEDLSKFRNKLYTLYLGYNEITSLEGIEKLNKLEDLYIHHNLISKIEGFDKIKKLRVLDLSHNKIQKIEGLENLNKLEEINLKGNDIPLEDLEEIGGLDSEGYVKSITKVLEYCKIHRPPKKAKTSEISSKFEYLKSWPMDIIVDYCSSNQIELERDDDVKSIVEKIEKSDPQEKPRLRLTNRLLTNSIEFKDVIYHFNLEDDFRSLLYNLRPITELQDLSELTDDKIIKTILAETKYDAKREAITDLLETKIGKHYEEVLNLLALSPVDLYKPEIILKDDFVFEEQDKEIHLIEYKIQGNYERLKIDIDKELNNQELEKIGRWGEKVIHDYLLEEYANKKNIKILWLNEHKESFEPYDILLLEDNHPIFIEVKSTITNSRSFTISGKELNLARKFGKDYILYVVINVGSPNAFFYKIEDFYEKYQKNHFKIKNIALNF